MPGRSEKQKKALEKVQERNRERRTKKSEQEKPKVQLMDMSTQTEDVQEEPPPEKRRKTSQVNFDECFIDSDETDAEENNSFSGDEPSDDSFEDETARRLLMIGNLKI